MTRIASCGSMKQSGMARKVEFAPDGTWGCDNAFPRGHPYAPPRVLDRLRNSLRSSREGHSARRQVESELRALQGALNHALRARDPVLLAQLPDTPQWDRYESQLARGRKTRTLNLGPAYAASRSLRRAAREAQEAAGRPITELPEADQRRLWNQA